MTDAVFIPNLIVVMVSNKSVKFKFYVMRRRWVIKELERRAILQRLIFYTLACLIGDLKNRALRQSVPIHKNVACMIQAEIITLILDVLVSDAKAGFDFLDYLVNWPHSFHHSVHPDIIEECFKIYLWQRKWTSLEIHFLCKEMKVSISLLIGKNENMKVDVDGEMK